MLGLFVTFNMKTVCIVLYVNPQWQQTRCTNNVNAKNPPKNMHSPFPTCKLVFIKDEPAVRMCQNAGLNGSDHIYVIMLYEI